MAGYYPIFMKIDDRNVLIVGGGVVAQRKAEVMLDYGADLTLVTPTVTPRVRAWSDSGRIRWLARHFQDDDLNDRQLVFAATDDHDLNRRVSALAEERGLPVNVADVPELCSFIVPSLFRRGHLSVAVSTGGLCPSYSRWVRLALEQTIDDSYAEALLILEELRKRVYGQFRDSDYDTRRRVMEAVLALDLPHIVRTRGGDAATRAAEEVIRNWASGQA